MLTGQEEEEHSSTHKQATVDPAQAGFFLPAGPQRASGSPAKLGRRNPAPDAFGMGADIIAPARRRCALE
jgi:hypothetical protein